MSLAALIQGALALVGCTGTRPDNLGLFDGKFAPCPDKPNCVSSMAPAGNDHAIAPIPYTGGADQAMARLKSCVSAMDRADIVTSSPRYMHVEFTSRVLRFVDDAQFFVDEKDRVIHVRSASRLGRSDFGVNRGRVESIRQAFAAKP